MFPILPALLTLVLGPTACDTDNSNDPRVVVRAASVDDAVTRYDLELDGVSRVAWAIEREDGERAVLVAAPDGELLGAARTADDHVVDIDLARTQARDAEVLCVATACAETDAITAEVIDLVLADELPEAIGWRTSSVQKKYDDTAKGVAANLGG